MTASDEVRAISIPQTGHDYWEGTTDVACACGGRIVWAEAGFVPGSRACRRCLALYAVRGRGADRRLVPQGDTDDGVLGDVDPAEGGEVYRVPADLYPGFQTEADRAAGPDA